MGFISEKSNSLAWSYTVPLLAFAYISAYSFFGSKPVLRSAAG
jgi:fucose permease